MKNTTILLYRFLQLFGYSYQHQFLQARSQTGRLARGLEGKLGEAAWIEALEFPELSDDALIIQHLHERANELVASVQEYESRKREIQEKLKPESRIKPRTTQNINRPKSIVVSNRERARLHTELSDVQARIKSLSSVMEAEHPIFAKLRTQEETYIQQLANIRIDEPDTTPPSDPSIPAASPATIQLQELTTRLNTAKAELKKVQKTLWPTYQKLGAAIFHAWGTDRQLRRKMSRHKHIVALIRGTIRSYDKYSRLTRKKITVRDNSVQP